MKLSTKRRALLVNGALGVLLLGGVGAVYASLSDGSAAESVTVPTVRVARGDVEAAVSAAGSVESARTRSLGFGTSGTVEKIYVAPGDKVKKGQVLARLDDDAAREGLAAAAASLATADDDTGTAAGYAQYVNARNAYNAAKRTLAGTVIKAPFAGTVTAVNGTEGGSASGSGGSSGGGASAGGSGGSSGSGGGSGFIELADTERLQIVGNFTESDVTRLKVGQAATFTFDALPGVTAEGEVTLIDPVARTSNNVVQYAVTISMTEAPEPVRLGQTTTVRVVVERAENVLTVPSAAVRTVGGRSTVQVVRQDGAQVTRQVEVGVRGESAVEIKSGLNEGDEVVRSLTTGTGSTRGGTFPGGGFPGLGGGGGGGRVGGGPGGGR